MMRHLVEVRLVPEVKHQWARALRDKRSKQGLPLPSVSLRKTGGDGGMLCGLMRCLYEEVDKEIVRLVVSVI